MTKYCRYVGPERLPGVFVRVPASDPSVIPAHQAMLVLTDHVRDRTKPWGLYCVAVGEHGARPDPDHQFVFNDFDMRELTDEEVLAIDVLES